MRLRIANKDHTKTYSCMRYNEHTHATNEMSENGKLPEKQYAQFILRESR